MRTVPGAKVGPDGAADDCGRSTPCVPSPERPTNTPTTTTTATSTSAPVAHAQPNRRRGAPGGRDAGAEGGAAGGVRTGERCTATPGPAGVATSDHPLPLHHRTMPAAPS